VERAEGLLGEIRDGVAGELIAGIYPSLMGPVGARLVTEVMARDPRVRLRLVGTGPDTVLPALLSRRLDVAVVLRYQLFDEPLPPSTGVRQLFAERFVALVPSELEPAVRQRGLAALGDQPWISGAAHLPCTRTVQTACRAAGFVPDVRHSDADYQAAAALVAAGLGVAVVPELSVATPPPHIKKVPCADIPPRRVALLFRRGTETRLAIRAVLRASTALKQSSMDAAASG
jgi:DNA-binding transcriptional LysR family regulator